MAEIRNLTRNGETFYPLTHSEAVIGMDEFRDAITSQVENYRPIEITGDVVNAPDEEDITTDSNNLLKFKNRNSLYGLGKVILRRGSSFASQVTQTNTIYVVQYDFDLENTRVTLPSGSVLKFEGGSLSNGTLIYSGLTNAILVYYQDQSVVLNSVTLEGNFTHKACDKVVADEVGLTRNASGTLSIKDGGVTGDKINSGVVNTDDLSIVNNKIQLADRGTTNGMGKIILRKDLSFASQLTQTNTIYVIRYNFALTGDVTIPENCILEFDGGSISGEHTITGQNTGIEAGLVKIFNTDVTLAGTWNISGAYPEWFDKDFVKCADTFERITFTQNYSINKSIVINHYVNIEIKTGALVSVSESFTDTYLFVLYGVSGLHRKKPFTITGGGRINLAHRACFLHTNLPQCNIVVSDLTIFNLGGQVNNIGEAALYMEYGELTLSNTSISVDFSDEYFQDYTHELIPKYCISCTYDAIINDVVLVTPKTGIKSLGCTTINNLHIWWGQNQIPNHDGIYCEVGLELGISAHNINNFYSDNIKTVFKFINNEGQTGPGIVYPTISASNVMLGLWYFDSSVDCVVVDNEEWVKAVGHISFSSDNLMDTRANSVTLYKYNGSEVTPQIMFSQARLGGPFVNYKHYNMIAPLQTSIEGNTGAIYIKRINDFSSIGVMSIFGATQYNNNCVHIRLNKLYTITGLININICNTSSDTMAIAKITILNSGAPRYTIIDDSLQGNVSFKYLTSDEYIDIYINNSVGGSIFIIKNNTNGIISIFEHLNPANIPAGAINMNTSQRKVGTSFPTFERYSHQGYMFLKDDKPYWWNGTAWVDATGATV